MKDLAGKTAVITGAASGMGFAMAERFAAAGMRIVMTDIEREALQQAEKKLRTKKAETFAVVRDVSDRASVEALKEAALERFGAVHLLCNNAGVFSAARVWETSEEVWKWIFGVNVWGVVHGISVFLPLLLAQNEGHVVNTASVSGLLTAPLLGAYNASKHAVVGISETLYHELAMADTRVGVSVLCPGGVNTNIFTAERNWPDHFGDKPVSGLGTGVQTASGVSETMMAPAAVAEMVHDAVVHEQFWILTHPDMAAGVVPRYQQALRAENPSIASLGALGDLGGAK